jgi:hypothetical protein
MRSLKGKTLFITGASRGIGRAIALRAAADGARAQNTTHKTTVPYLNFRFVCGPPKGTNKMKILVLLTAILTPYAGNVDAGDQSSARSAFANQPPVALHQGKPPDHDQPIHNN